MVTEGTAAVMPARRLTSAYHRSARISYLVERTSIPPPPPPSPHSLQLAEWVKDFLIFLWQQKNSFPALYGCETWPAIMTRGHRLSFFGHKELSKIFRLSGKKQKKNGENYIIRSFIIFNKRQTLLRWAGHVARRGRTEIHTELLL